MVARGFLGIYLDVLAMVVRLQIGSTMLAAIAIRVLLAFMMVEAEPTVVIFGSILIVHGHVLEFSAAIVEMHGGSCCRESIYKHKAYGEHFNHGTHKGKKKPRRFQLPAGLALFHFFGILNVAARPVIFMLFAANGSTGSFLWVFRLAKVVG